jgi:serine/threonine protein kinase
MSFQIKDYIIDRKRIGKGSFSSIYKCYHKITNNKYAIKEIIIDKNHNKGVIKREFNVLKKLDHPNIIKLHDVIIDTNFQNIYFVMDYHILGDLSKFLNKRPLKEKYCKKYLRQLSHALKYLLNNNVLHRDLKPQNILMSSEHNIVVTDFGFAKNLNEDTLITTLCGSPMYMAPEIFNKQKYNNKSDLWSVGIIMYEILHGYTPYRVATFIELINKINNENISINKNLNLSLNCLNLLKQLIDVDVTFRIEWSDFFNHRWFENDEILKKENKLLEIDINNIPNINNYNVNEAEFCSYTHKSIIQSNELNFNLLFNESIDESDNDLYVSAASEIIELESSEQQFEQQLDKNENEFEQKIDENNNEISYFNINSETDINFKLLTEKNDEFIIINSQNIKSNSLPVKNKTISESFKQYLYSSINILKHSYKYINNKSI